MSYPQQDDPNIILDTIHRKEFYWVKKWKHTKPSPIEDVIPRFLLDEAISRGSYLRLHSYQIFVSNFLNPDTNNSRLLMKWETGTGKTMGALAIAMKFIDKYRKEQETGSTDIGSIFIIGFSEKVFKNELLRYPEFGFLSKEEHTTLDKLKRLSLSGSMLDIQKYHEMIITIKKRFSNRKGNGFFRFYGYRAFVNRIFISTTSVDINGLSELEIVEAISQGRLKYDEALLAQFKNSLIICDEIHNVYNSNEKNNWGIAIQAVLDAQPTARGLFMSATPLNNSPTEIVDLLNLLLPSSMRLKKSDFFLPIQDRLRPNALSKLAELCRGRVSFLRNVNPKYYPALYMDGEELESIPMLRLTRTPMSAYQYATYKQIYNGALAQDSQYVVDVVLPNPDTSESVGLYKTEQIKRALVAAPDRWKQKNGLDFVDGKLVGDIFRRQNLLPYSPKYVRLLDRILQIIRMGRGKIFIYHNIVHMSGVLFIEQLLLKNGILDEFSNSIDSTICSKCGIAKREHTKEQLAELIQIHGAADQLSRTNHDNQLPNNSNYQVNSNSQSANNSSHQHSQNHYPYKVIKQSTSSMSAATSDLEKFSVFNAESEIPDITYSLYKNPDFVFLSYGNINRINKNVVKYLLDLGLPIIIQVFVDRTDPLRDTNPISDKLFPDVWTILNRKDSYDYYVDIKHENFRVETLDRILQQIDRDIYAADNGIDKESDEVSDSDSDSDNADSTREQLVLDEESPDDSAILDDDTTNISNDDELLLSDDSDSDSNDSIGILDHSVSNSIHGAAERRNIDHTHKFIPVRFIMAHSDIDKIQMDHSIEKYNHFDNASGHKYMILVGSKIIKESYDIKAVRNVLVAGRPDNISAFIQIRGRAVRNNSHRDLPPTSRDVHVEIFTSCLPRRRTSPPDKGGYDLSYEEEKYAEKIKSYKVIQQIEKVLHENAIDAYTNKDIIQPPTIETVDPLAILPFEPNIPRAMMREFKPSELNLSTFNIYHTKNEIELIRTLIKRLFIEISPVWTYADLFAAVKRPQVRATTRLSSQGVRSTKPALIDYEPEINTELFAESSFVIALSALIWDKSLQYIEPIIKKSSAMSSLLERLYDPNDKLITLPGGQESIIMQIGEYYMLLPINPTTNEPIIEIEAPFRAMIQETSKIININNFIQSKKIDFDYEDKKKIFYRRWTDIAIENMENVICEYGAAFHLKFLEETIEYVFGVWTNVDIEKSEYHEFYFKMLYYYDLLSLVIWAYTAKPRIMKEYSKYIIPVKSKDIKLKVFEQYEKHKDAERDYNPPDNSDLSTSGVINLLKTSINRTSNVWVPSEFREYYNKVVEDSLKLFSGKRKRVRHFSKVSAQLLPIGHFIGKFPKFYQPDKGWIEDATYSQMEQSFVENPIVIGYDRKSKTGVHIRFKIRPPIQNIKMYKDSRMIEKGATCKSKNKKYLQKIADKLDIIMPNRNNVEDLCMLIRSKLIRNELKERVKRSKIKWFYHHYDVKPED